MGPVLNHARGQMVPKKKTPRFMRESSAQGKAAVVKKKIFLITPMPCHVILILRGKPTFVAESKQKEKKKKTIIKQKKKGKLTYHSAN